MSSYQELVNKVITTTTIITVMILCLSCIAIGLGEINFDKGAGYCGKK